MEQQKLEYFFNIFKAFQAPLLDGNMAERRIYGIRAFSSVQGWFFNNTWRVVGITQEALDAFKTINFKRIPTRKDPIAVERAHINQRSVWLDELFARQWDNPNDWWNYIYNKDRVILATVLENKQSDQSGTPLKIAYDVPDNGEYFQTSYIGCKYRKKERALLESFI